MLRRRARRTGEQRRKRLPCFTIEGDVCALLAAKNWLNVFLCDGAIVPDPHQITSGHHNQTARTVAIRRGANIDAPMSKRGAS